MKQKQVRNILLFISAIIVVAMLSSCATHAIHNVTDPPGFFKGLLHGFLIMFNFILSLFSDYEIYNFPNSGGWYDFGFLIGASMFLGGGSGVGVCRNRK